MSPQPKSKRSLTTPTAQDYLRIAATAYCDPRTVVKCYGGLVVRALVRLRIEQAALKLKLAAPPLKES